MKNFKKGFTLIELLVVIAIIGILMSVVLVTLTGSKNKGNDAKVQSQLRSMFSQAQLFSGTPAITSLVFDNSSTYGTGGSSLFSFDNIAKSSLYRLIVGLPANTNIYYGSEDILPFNGGKWFFAAASSKGAFCIDYTDTLVSWSGTPPTSLATFGTAFPNASSYSCK